MEMLMMINLLRRVVARIVREFRQTAIPAPAGKVDFRDFEDAVKRYRNRGTTIGHKVRLLGHIDGLNPQLVSIGDYSVIGGATSLLSHCPIKGALPCTVGKFVYVGYGALVLPGVTISDCVIVGAGAVVTRNVASGSVVAGNPARVLRMLTAVEQENLRNTMLAEKFFGWAEENNPQ
jgi:acetyltransferase-like isoleucine patch superfamily enzyme